ncbi:YeeE/YedE family protein [Halobacteriovorax sp. JY17]|uniref:YeeE/YedE family protein n=1 Tax=Halobacteriovorax sp. JY17 TaxID=2014617 RepID=UPI000C4B8495|nr:YeeE/YedE family protein [Halobacteriovorax sp. JY17]PIK16417.1 MAG: YeeE/YedE family protein [Halobacteriovorax sp. JY17]
MENILYPLGGGILIGISSTILLAGIGRISGISGILSSVISRPAKEHFWKYNFLLGLLIGGGMTYVSSPQLFNYSVNDNLIKVIIAGLLVGFGTRLGNGCTSGHGVCGMSRMAKRSIIATITFILVGMITVTIEGLIK